MSKYNNVYVRGTAVVTTATFTVPYGTHQVTYNGTVNTTVTMYDGDETYPVVGFKNISDKKMTIQFVNGQQAFDRTALASVSIEKTDGIFLQWDGLYWVVVGSYTGRYFTRDLVAVTADQNFTLSGRNAILDVFGEGNNANPVTINIGTTPGGTDIANAQVIPGNGALRLQIGNLAWLTNQVIYISSSNWNGANIDLNFDCRKI